MAVIKFIEAMAAEIGVPVSELQETYTQFLADNNND